MNQSTEISFSDRTGYRNEEKLCLESWILQLCLKCRTMASLLFVSEVIAAYRQENYVYIRNLSIF
jgi:hypothetical protein